MTILRRLGPLRCLLPPVAEPEQVRVQAPVRELEQRFLLPYGPPSPQVAVAPALIREALSARVPVVLAQVALAAQVVPQVEVARQSIGLLHE